MFVIGMASTSLTGSRMMVMGAGETPARGVVSIEKLRSADPSF